MSKVQLEEFNKSCSSRFLKRLANLALRLRPDLTKCLPPEDIERFSEVVTAEARQIGFATDFEIAVFYAATLLEGKYFHRDPSHKLFDILARRDVHPRLRATQLLYELEKLADQRRPYPDGDAMNLVQSPRKP